MVHGRLNPKKKHAHDKRKLHDVFHDPKKRVLSLKRKEYKVEVRFSDILTLFRKFRFIIATILIISVVGLVLFGKNSISKADVATFYPTTCLGGWEGPEHATGEPNVDEKHSIAFSRENSAVLEDRQAQLFCGDFKGTIPEHSDRRKVTVHFSWTMNPDDIALQKPIATTTTIVDTDFASTSTKIIEMSDNTSSTLTITDVPQSATSSDATEKSEIQSPESNTAPVPEPVPDLPTQTQPESPSVPVSFLQNLFMPLVHAETVDESSSTSETMVNPEPVVVSESTTTTTDTVQTPAPVDQTATVIEAPMQSKEDFLVIKYTLDGKTWNTLGLVNADQFDAASFELPLDVISDWSDISHIQISVESVPTVEQHAPVYLDSIILDVEYGDETEMTPEELEAYRQLLPFKKLHVQNIVNPTDNLQITSATDSESKERLVVKYNGQVNNIRIYSGKDKTFSYVIAIGDQGVEIPAYTFMPGTYTMVVTAHPDACQTLTLSECISNEYFIASSTFAIIDLDKKTK